MKNYIKVERARLDMTQPELAKKIQVSTNTVVSIEKGKYVPSTVLALKIAAVFNKKVEEIFFLEDSDWKP